MRLAAFDLGASSGKLFVGGFYGDRLSLEHVHDFPNGVVQLGDGMYWDFLDIYRQLTLGLQKASAGGSVASVGIDGFNNDFGLISRTGELLCPVRAYRDSRTEVLREAIYRRMSPRALYMRTGNQIAPFNTLMQLAAMVEAGQGHMLEGADRFLHLPDLLAYYLTGEKASEYTLAAETQFLDMNSREWLTDVLSAFSIPPHLFGRVTTPGTFLGKLSARYCDHAGIKPIAFASVCEHDTASAFLAAPVDRDTALISSGTWSLVGVEVDAPIITEYSFRCNIANEGGMPGHHRLLINVMGSWILQELQRNFAVLGKRYDFDEIGKMALEADAFQFLIDVDDRAFYAPGNMIGRIRDMCLALYGRAPESPAEFFRCAYESLAMKCRLAIERLETLIGHRLDTIRMVGGSAQDPIANQFTADACARPLLAGPVNASAIGNILAQLMAAGAISSVGEGRELVSRSFPLERYFPQQSTAWEEQYQRFKERFT